MNSKLSNSLICILYVTFEVVFELSTVRTQLKYRTNFLSEYSGITVIKKYKKTIFYEFFLIFIIIFTSFGTVSRCVGR